MGLYNIVMTIVWPFSILKFKMGANKDNLPKVLTSEQTLERLINSRISFSRFGDGELMWMSHMDPSASFQTVSSKMGDDLTEVFESNDDNLMLGLPDQVGGTFSGGYFNTAWWCHWHNTKFEKISEKVNFKGRTFANANTTRFFDTYKDKTKSKLIAGLWKQVWENRNVILVEGELTRFGIGNDFLKSAKSVSRILCPAENAYDSIDKILDTTIRVATQVSEPLILCALGPTATILCYKLSQNTNFQAVDIGHADIEYEWLRSGKSKIAIPGKYVNEASDGHNTADLKKQKIDGLKEYQDEVVANVTVTR